MQPFLIVLLGIIVSKGMFTMQNEESFNVKERPNLICFKISLGEQRRGASGHCFGYPLCPRKRRYQGRTPRTYVGYREAYRVRDRYCLCQKFAEQILYRAAHL